MTSIVSVIGRELDEFGVEVNFEKNTPAPSRVFRAMSGYIESFEFIDSELLSSVTTRIKPTLLLEDVEAGSVRTWLKNTLESIDDEALKTGDYKKLIGAYLVKGKKILIDFMAQKTTVESPSDLTALQTELLSAAEESDVLRISTYHPVPVKSIAESLQSLAYARAPLFSVDSAKYLSTGSELPISMTFTVSPEQIRELLVREELSSESAMILRVKKPDFIGDSMWDFIYDGRTLSIKMYDTAWLMSFRDGSILLRPGDSLRATVKSRVRYGFDNEVVDSQYDLLKVLDVLHRSPQPPQMLLS